MGLPAGLPIGRVKPTSGTEAFPGAGLLLPVICRNKAAQQTLPRRNVAAFRTRLPRAHRAPAPIRRHAHPKYGASNVPAPTVLRLAPRLAARAPAIAFRWRTSSLSCLGGHCNCRHFGGPDETPSARALPAHLARDALFPRGREGQRRARGVWLIGPPAAMPACRRASRRFACAASYDRAPTPPVACVPKAARPASPMRHARPLPPRVREDAAALHRCRSACSALCARFSALKSTDACDAIRRRTRQSACLRRNAGMSYVSTPFSCSACTCEAAVSRELRHTAGVSNAP
jgi:hypothetical protein